MERVDRPGYRLCAQREEDVVITAQESIVAGIAEIIEEVTGIDPAEVTLEKRFVDDLEIDSLSLVEIAVQLEDRYEVKIPDEDMGALRTVGDAVAYVQRMGAENPELAAELKARTEEVVAR